MNKKRHLFSTLFLLFVFLISCSNEYVSPTSTPSIQDTVSVETAIPEIPNSSTPTLTPIPFTPTLTASPSFTPTATINPFSTPKSIITLSEDHPSNTIFVWSGSQYGWLNPHSYQEDPGFVFADTPEIDPSFQAKTFAFAQNSHQVAYVFYENHATLWVADINLEHAVQLWVDEEDWLTYFSEGSSGYINWGLNDHFIFLSRKSIGMVYQLQNDQAIYLSGPCDRIAISPFTNQLAVWCPTGGETETAYLVLEQDGTSSLENILPEENVLVGDWVFAPHSNKVLYADSEGKIFIWDGDLNIQTDLHTLYGYRADGDAKILKWSFDGTKVIIFGYSENHLCPISSNGNELACWVIRDANTGEILWWPNEQNLPQEAVVALSDGFEIALSPDNQWVVLPYRASLIKITIVVSLITGEIQSISSTLWATVFWSK